MKQNKMTQHNTAQDGQAIQKIPFHPKAIAKLMWHLPPLNGSDVIKTGIYLVKHLLLVLYLIYLPRLSLI